MKNDPGPRPRFESLHYGWLSASLALVLALAAAPCAHPQDSAGSSPRTPAASSAAAPIASQTQPQAGQPAKKIWSNDDLTALRDKNSVSVVGAPAIWQAPASATKGAPPKPPAAPGKTAKWYHDQLQTLYARRAQVEKQLDDMRHFQDGSYRASGSPPLQSYTLMSVSPNEGIRRLEKQRGAIQNQIDQLEDQARHASIPPGDLR